MTTRPTRRDLACLLVYGLILALFLIPRYLAGGTLYFSAPHEHSGVEIHAAFQLANRALWSEGVPLWNPWSGCGTPHLANLQSSVLFPLHWMFLALPPLPAAELLLVTRLVLTALLAHAFARALGLSTPAACLVALAYTMNAWELRFANNAYGNATFLLPATCHAFLRLGERGGGRALLAAMATTALLVLAGLPEAAVFSVAFASLFLAVGARRVVPRASAVRTLRLLAAALLGGVALAAAQIVPFLEYLGQSWSTHLGAVDFRDRRAPAESAFGIAYPFTDPTLPVSATSLSPGVVVLCFALLGTRAAGGLGVALGSFALLGGLKLFGVQPVHALGRLPLVDTLNFPLYLPPALHLSLAVLAGFGLDRWRAGAGRGARRTFLGAGAVLAVVWWLAPHPSPREAYAWSALAVTAGVVLLGATRRGRAPALATGAVLLLLTGELWLHDGRVPVDTTLFEAAYGEGLAEGGSEVGAFVAETMGDQLRFRLAGSRLPNIGLFWGPVRGFDYRDAILVDRYWNYMVNAPELWGYGAPDELEPEDTRLLDVAAVGTVVVPGGISKERSTDLMERVIDRGLRSFDGPGPVSIEPVRARSRAAAIWSTPPFEATLRRFELGSFERIRCFLGTEDRLEAPLRFRMEFAHRDQRRLLLERTLGPGDEGWHDLAVDLPDDLERGSLVLSVSGQGAGDARVAFGGIRLARTGRLRGEGLRPLREIPPYTVYENPAALPRARVVHQAVVAPRAEVERVLESPDLDPARTVVLEQEPPIELTGTAGPSTARIVESGARRVVVELESAGNGLLLLADTYYPGWRARVDGREQPILAANLMFRAVPVTAGEHRVEFTYAPWSFRLGALVSLAAILAVSAALVRPGRKAAT